MNIITLVPDAETDLVVSKQTAYEPLLKRRGPPHFENLEQERLAAGFRIFAALGFSEGVAWHY